MKDMKENRFFELNDEDLKQVTGGVGGSNFDLTDEMIASGQYWVGQRDRITYNKVIYYNLNTKVLINQIEMNIYEAASGERLYIPFYNYS